MKYHVLKSSIVLNYDGKTLTISEDDDRFDKVIVCIRENRLDDIPGIVELERTFEGTGMELRDGVIYEGGQPIPTELNAKILRYKELGLPFDSLLKFWENLKLNPSFNSRTMLYKFLEHNGHPFTEDGCFIAYRGVREDFKDKHTGKFDNSVGATCKIDRSEVDDNPNNTCSHGLHVACFEYAKSFGPQLVEVKVNPRDVVAVPTDYNGTKMRVCQFEVVAIGEFIRNEVIYGQPLPDEHNCSEDCNDEHEDDEEDESDLNNCPSCDEEDAAFYNFCPACGHKQD